MKPSLTGGACLIMSLGAHIGVVQECTTENVERVSPPSLPSIVELSVAPARTKQTPPKVSEPDPPEPIAPTPRPPEPRSIKPVVTEPEAPVPEPTAPDPIHQEPEVADHPPELTGTTLLGPSGDGFSAPLGNGDARSGVAQAGLSRSVDSATKTRKVNHVAPRAHVTVPLAKLSKKPAPPNLEGALRDNYPASARAQGKGGEARVRARIESTGRVHIASITEESSRAFGEACRSVLLTSVWSAPLDQKGRPVATFVTYRCRFRVED